MNGADNVATALVDLAPGTHVPIPGASGIEAQLTARSVIPFGHKIALRDIAPGEPVLKYGEEIGLASARIAAGDHVHTHNVDSQRGRGDLAR